MENLCHHSFFADFTVRSPKYQKSGRLEKEAADLLVVFQDTLLAIQVKSKTVDPSVDEKDPVAMSRILKALQHAIHQFRALGEALHTPNFTSLLNGHGTEIEFEKKKITNFIFIVVFVPVWQDAEKESAQIRFDPACYAEGKIPIHLFSLDQFTALLTLLDTLPDFLFYLEARWSLHGEKVIPRDSNPIDEWTLITFERKLLVEILERKALTDITGLSKRYTHAVEQLERQEKPSYFIDRLIKRFHAAIGVDMPFDSRFRTLEKPNSIKSYDLMIHYLAQLNRRERSRLTESLMSRVQNCQRNGIAFRGIKFKEDSNVAYLVLAATGNRRDRRVALGNVARGMGHKLKVKVVVGLAVGHEWPVSSECDVAVVDVSRMKVDQDLIDFTNHGFKKPRVSKG